MGKVRQISANLDGFRCTNNDNNSGNDCAKNSFNTIPIAGAFNPAVTITNQKSPWAKLGKTAKNWELQNW
jgi:hypothetical protein